MRVINNVVKKMDVKPRFYDAFRKDGYQGTFQFKQKVRTAWAGTFVLRVAAYPLIQPHVLS